MLLEIWLIYVTTTFTSVVMPGPSMLLALYHGGRYGTRRTLATALGVVLASLILGTISAVGLGVILTASLVVFQLIKWLGAAYLIYLGLNLWRNSTRPVQPLEDEQRDQQVPVVSMFRQAFWVSLGNPKPVIFFTAFFPQFIDPQQAQSPQYLVMLATLAVVVFGCVMLYALGGQKLRPWLQNFQVKKWLDRLAGTVFIGFGIKLAVSK
jgi:RhtB (resistance to homoserine/threonine) family protein